jgi:hypothetical protein
MRVEKIMSYDALVTIGISIKDGPPPVQEKRTLSDVIAANAKRITFKIPKDPMGWMDVKADDSSDMEARKAICRQLKFSLEKETTPQPQQQQQQMDQMQGKEMHQTAKIDERLAFVAIKASKYLYKRCVNMDAGGVGFRLGECTPMGPLQGSRECGKIEWMTGDRVLLNICGALDFATAIEVFVDEKLFDCSKKDGDEVVVTITYGVIGVDSESDGTTECCGPTNATVGSVPNRNVRQLAHH